MLSCKQKMFLSLISAFCICFTLNPNTIQALKCDYFLNGDNTIGCFLTNSEPTEMEFNHSVWQEYGDENVTALECYDDLSHLELFDNFWIEKFPNLRNVIMEHAKIDEIATNAFETCDHVEEITFGSTGVGEIPTGLFTNCQNLKNLKLDYNNLTAFPTFKEISHLEKLNLDGNKLVKLTSEDFKYLDQLLDLQMAKNDLITFDVDNLFNLESLDLRGNALINFIVRNFTRLESLNLSNNKLSAFTIDGPCNLVNLDISQNFLIRISQTTFKNAINLRSLKANGNENFLDGISERSFESLPNLEILDISTCGIEKLSDFSFYMLENLRFLDVSHNKISDLPDFSPFHGLQNLESIEISSNALTSIKYSTFNSNPMLKVLDLSNNMIKNIEENSFKFLRNLERLDLSSNNLENVNSNIFSNPRLHSLELDVSHNRIASIDPNLLIEYSSFKLKVNGNTCVNSDIETIAITSLETLKRCIENYLKSKETTSTMKSTAPTTTVETPKEEELNFNGMDLFITMACIISIALLMVLLAFYLHYFIIGHNSKVEVMESKDNVGYQRF